MKLGFIGTGKISSSVITGICKSNISYKKIIISPRNRKIAKNLKNRFKKIQSIKIPTLIVHGKDDPLLKVKNAYKMHKLIPASELIIIEDMRHLIEQPILDQFKDRLIIHLNSNS